MANYTQDEIQAVVEQLVRSSIRRPYDTLGVRRNDITFSDIQESTAGVLLLYPKSPFYLAFLSGGRLKEVLEEEVLARQNVLDALAVLRRRSLPVRDVSSLVNAKVALFELEGTVTSSNPPKDITNIPAYKRFNSNLNRFLGAVGGNIKKDGDIVLTPEQARQQLPDLIRTWKKSVLEALRRIPLLADALNNYNSLGLAQRLAAGVVQRSMAMLDARVTSLESLNETQRNEVLRDTVLEVLGIKAVVAKFGAFPGLSAGTSATGTLSMFADSSRPANPASALVPTQGLLVLIPGEDAASSTNILKVWLNGAPTSGTPSVELFLPSSKYPKIDSTKSGPYTFVVGEAEVDNNELNFTFTNPSESKTITFLNSTYTTTQFAALLTDELYAYGFRGETYFYPVMYDGQVTISGNTISPTYGFFPANSVVVGYEVEIYYGVNAITTRTVTAVNTSSGNIVSFTVGGAPLTASTTDRIKIGDSSTKRFSIVPIDKVQTSVARRTITLNADTDVRLATGYTIGIYGTTTGTARPWDIATISDFISKNNAVCVSAGEVSAVLSNTTVTTDPADGFALYLTSTSGVLADMVVSVPSGVNAGKYSITSVDPANNRVKISKVIPQAQAGFGSGLAMTGCSVGWDQYRITSKGTLLTSSVSAIAPKEDGEYVTVTGSVSSNYVTFPNLYKSVVVGDRIEIYETSSTTPSRTLEVLEVFTDDVAKLSGSIATSYSFVTGTVPFVRVSKGNVSNFDSLSATLRAQMAMSDANSNNYFLDLNRFVNPLLVNTSPTNSDVAQAEARVQDMGDVLGPVAVAIDAFSPDIVPEMDQLVRGLKEKGADRAVDILLECRFVDFFGLSQEQTSYAGALQGAIREVATNDLPVHKSNRLARSNSPLRISSPSPDYEIDTSDEDTSPMVDPPVDVDSTIT